MSYHKSGCRETRCFECEERSEGDVEVLAVDGLREARSIETSVAVHELWSV